MSKKLDSLLDLDSKTTRSWKVEIDGKEVTVKNRLSIIHPHLGRLDYAKSPVGYDAISFRGVAKGGVVVVPYTFIDSELFIGFVEQPRPNLMDEKGNYVVFNIPRGATEKNESFLQSAKREISEEARIDPDKQKYILKRLSNALNMDSGFFETVPAGKSGVEFFSMQIKNGLFDRYKENVYKLKPNVILDGTDIEEHITRSLFFHWTKVFDMHDGISLLAVLLLRASLE